jgi:hypothetical protein
MRTSWICAVALGLLTLSTPALAVDPPVASASLAEDAATPAPSTEVVEPGYHLELAALDAAALAVGATGAWLASNDSTASGNALAVAGFVTYAYGGPILHGLNRGTSHGFGSWGLRAGIPVVGALVGYAAAGSCDESGEGILGDCFLHGVEEAAIGFAVGIPIAMVVDNALLAGPRTTETPQVMVHLQDGSAGLSLAGTF